MLLGTRRRSRTRDRSEREPGRVQKEEQTVSHCRRPGGADNSKGRDDNQADDDVRKRGDAEIYRKSPRFFVGAIDQVNRLVRGVQQQAKPKGNDELPDS